MRLSASLYIETPSRATEVLLDSQWPPRRPPQVPRIAAGSGEPAGRPHAASGLRPLPQRARSPRDRATKPKRRHSFTPAPPITISARGARRWLKPAPFTRHRSLSARRRLSAGRVTYCTARQLHERSGLLSAPSGSRQDASRSSGVPPPRIISACLSSMCRHLVKVIAEISGMDIRSVFS
ncbi:hypothetical protein NDU88_005826 [Pleurodeles waltl]|uniref:Uncharacterized protein n=1 Tax=Pleurodeles waltl TaxID=8319 RepID=A0AAV7TVW0_PLEWA|nr:hypothetical protein NDU88_005826 [Pleurodeles waltl]